jgi:prepilin-type N-terminal cleavage/methylation domain-containing protein/prepilin-type processing-associated H-X9-DG protein
VARGKAFTLVELLVVIAVISLLLAILVPATEKARRQARAVACQVNLRQWGTTLAAFAEDNDGLFPRIDYWVADGLGALWILTGRSVHEATNGRLQGPRQYHPISTEGMLCPEATTPGEVLGAGGGYGAWDYGLKHGDTNRAWVLTMSGGPNNEVQVSYGSYGLNGWLFQERPGVLRTSRERAEAGQKRFSAPSYTNIFLLRRAAGVPLLLDSMYFQGLPTEGTRPPWEAGTEEGMGVFCMDRHSEHINALFLDWSVRKVGLKELWTLKWHEKFNTTGPWTKAGGATPEKWPPWMRGFKDY